MRVSFNSALIALTTASFAVRCAYSAPFVRKVPTTATAAVAFPTHTVTPIKAIAHLPRQDNSDNGNDDNGDDDNNDGDDGDNGTEQIQNDIDALGEDAGNLFNDVEQLQVFLGEIVGIANAVSAGQDQPFTISTAQNAVMVDAFNKLVNSIQNVKADVTSMISDTATLQTDLKAQGIDLVADFGNDDGGDDDNNNDNNNDN